MTFIMAIYHTEVPFTRTKVEPIKESIVFHTYTTVLYPKDNVLHVINFLEAKYLQMENNHILLMSHRGITIYKV